MSEVSNTVAIDQKRKVLLTGANGYIGRNLLKKLLAEKHEVHAVVRKGYVQYSVLKDPNLHVYVADLSKKEMLPNLPADIDTAFYLVHSLGDVSKDFHAKEQLAAQNFIDWVKSTRCSHIIYLSGLCRGDDLSPHFSSRLAVESVLKKSAASVTVFRASIIIGKFSSSFIMIRDLVEKLPIMIAPKWLNRYCQPISMEDVMFYLSSSMHQKQCLNTTFEIGGPCKMTFKEMLLGYAKYKNLKRFILTIPLLTPKLSSLWMRLVTRANFLVAYRLVESLKIDSTVEDDQVLTSLPHQCLSYQSAIDKASREKAIRKPFTYADQRTALTCGSRTDFLRELKSISTTEKIPFVWNIWRTFSGLFSRWDKPEKKEFVKGWLLEKYDEKEGILVLSSFVLFPGKGWIEYIVKDHPLGIVLSQTAYFTPTGILGHLYWQFMKIFHYSFFTHMVTSLLPKT